MKTVVGLFDSTSDAQRMLEDLMQMGFQADDISVVTSLSAQPKVESGSIHLDAMNLADVGKVAAAGPLRQTLKRTAGPSLALRGALERSGFPVELADRYAAGVERGGTLESLVVPDSEADRVVEAMKRRSAPEEKKTAERAGANGPAEREEDGRGGRLDTDARGKAGAVGETRAPAATSGERLAEQATRAAAASEGQRPTLLETLREGMTTSPSIDERERALETEEEWRIPVVREELRVGKRAVQRGAVRIAVQVVEKPVTEQIHLRESHVEVERRAVDRSPSAETPEGFKDQTIEVAVTREESVISKQARVVEEVIVHKHVTDRIETVRDSLRTTQVECGEVAPSEASKDRER
jgi:uncharacterized protein (TIGR02271 family)